MSGYGVLPTPAELSKMQALGLTHREIANHVFEVTGHKVTRNAVSMAMKRGGIAKQGERYTDLIPWRVRQTHANHYALALLRKEARRRRGQTVTVDWMSRLESWKRKLEETNCVVYYDPESVDGFYYVPRLPEDGDIIRRPPHDTAS